MAYGSGGVFAAETAFGRPTAGQLLRRAAELATEEVPERRPACSGPLRGAGVVSGRVLEGLLELIGPEDIVIEVGMHLNFILECGAYSPN